MPNWSEEELRKITQTDDLHISPFRRDGSTCGTPTWIWSVVVDGELFVRAYNGQQSSWYQSAHCTKGWPDDGCRHNEGGQLRTS